MDCNDLEVLVGFLIGNDDLAIFISAVEPTREPNSSFDICSWLANILFFVNNAKQMPSDSWGLDDSEKACLGSDRNGLLIRILNKNKANVLITFLENCSRRNRISEKLSNEHTSLGILYWIKREFPAYSLVRGFLVCEF